MIPCGVGVHENSSLDWTMMTTSQVPSCRFLKVCAAEIFVEVRFSGDPNYGMSEVVTQIVEILLITQELKPCELTRDAKFAPQVLL